MLLFFNCLLSFGSYFCFDIPSVLQDQFQGASSWTIHPLTWSLFFFLEQISSICFKATLMTAFPFSDRNWHVQMQLWSTGRWTVCWDWGWPRSNTIFFLSSILGRKDPRTHTDYHLTVKQMRSVCLSVCMYTRGSTSHLACVLLGYRGHLDTSNMVQFGHASCSLLINFLICCHLLSL